jgi:hypothetical protein
LKLDFEINGQNHCTLKWNLSLAGEISAGRAKRSFLRPPLPCQDLKSINITATLRILVSMKFAPSRLSSLAPGVISHNWAEIIDAKKF